MTSQNHFNPPATLSTIGRVALLLALLPALTGCLTVHTHRVVRTVVVDHVLDASLAKLVAQIGDSYKAVQSLNASVDITATTGGRHQGQVKEIPTFAGYIILRKPADLHVLMLVPVLRSRALEMTTDGKDFKLIIPSQSKAVVGSEDVVDPNKTGLETLRPGIIRDALLVPPVLPEEFVTLTENTRLMPPVTGRKETVEEPDYDLTVSRTKSGHELQTVRVIHISRVDLQPYEQDVYDPAGRIVTTVLYSKYQKFGDVQFPMSIFITRPIDEYTLKIDFSKLTLNPKIDDEQFVLKIPESYTIQKM